MSEPSSPIEIIEHEIVLLLRRADFKRTLDGSQVGLDRSAYILLKKLRDAGTCAIGDIAESFQLDVSTVSRQISSLETKGYIKRNTEPLDGRINLIEITESGLLTLEAAMQKRLLSYNQILTDWTDEERHLFASLLSRFNLALERRC
jgi:DNA-binding MarR family transcriptional regulator